MNNKIIGILVMTLLIGTACTSAAIIQSKDAEKQDCIIDGLRLYSIGIGLGNPPLIEWSKFYGGLYQDSIYSMEQTNDGGYICTGATKSHSQGTDYNVYLLKTDVNGNELWSKNMGYADKLDVAYCVQQTSDGGYIIVGTSDFGYPDYEAYWIKTDADGNIEIETRGLGQPDYEYGSCVRETPDGGYITIGSTSSYDPDSQVWLVKKDASLADEWSKNFGAGSGGNWIECTADGGYILAGYTTSPTHGTQILLSKNDANGNEEWWKSFGGTDRENGKCVKQTTDGGYIIVGGTFSYGQGGGDVYVIKTNAYGAKEWEKTIGTTLYETGSSIMETYDGGYFIVGSCKTGDDFMEYDAYVIKLDNNGNVEWEEAYGKAPTYDSASSGQQTSDGGYIIAACTQSYGDDDGDAWLIKLETQNIPPNKPTTTYDNTKDELVVSTTDPDGNQVKFGVSWNNDGSVDQWTTFYDSGAESRINCEGRKGTIGVIAEDEYGAQSDWVSVTPKNKSINTPFLQFLENHPHMFPLLRQLLALEV